MSTSLTLRRIVVAAAAFAAVAAPPGLGLTSTAQAAACLQQYLPDQDPACTPGVTDPRVSQDNMQQTICVPGYTRGVRPPASYTDERKRQPLAPAAPSHRRRRPDGGRQGPGGEPSAGDVSLAGEQRCALLIPDPPSGFTGGVLDAPHGHHGLPGGASLRRRLRGSWGFP
ncbi:MAG: hypothetical protein QOE72_3626 [Chloroflexota bacterium]|jgi:hypothetical protein|nr:hypothetical protein [Chloroflexota bacterium]